MRRLIAICVTVLVWAAPSSAQTAGREPAVLELPSSTRAVGLGHAYQMGAAESDAIFYNPAIASRAQGFSLGMYWLTSTARAYTASAATPGLGGGVAIGLQSLEYGAPGGPGGRLAGLDGLLEDGSPGASELVASIAYGRSLFGFRIGAAGKLVDQRFGGNRQQTAAVDVGIAHSLGPGWAGLSVRNMADRHSIGGVRVASPVEATLGVGAYGKPVGPLDLGLAAALTRRADGEVLVGGGLELGYWPVVGRTFVARVGLRNVPEGDASPVTFGGSVWLDDLALDYAFQPVDGTDGIHRISFAWR